jgi:hypothetical protein
MRRVLLSALFTATLLAPAAQAEVEPFFYDDFDRSESPIESWTPYGIVHAQGFGDGQYFGTNNVLVDDGAMIFSYWAFEYPLESTYYNAASVIREIDIPGPPTVRFSFTPDDAAFDFVFGIAFPGTSYCDAQLNTGRPGGSGVVPCSTPFAVRIVSIGSGGPTKPGGKDARLGHQAPVAPSANFVMVLGGLSEGYFSGFAGDIGSFPMVAGTTYQIEYTIADDGPGAVAITVSNGDLSTTVLGSSGGGDRKPGRQRAFAPELPAESFPLFVADAGLQQLWSLDGLSLRTTALHRFDDFLVIPSVGLPGETDPEPQYTITAEVEAKGKFKKQPIDIRKKGVLQATVYGDDSGDDALDVMDIRLESVTFGATGSETTTPALEVRYAHVDKDGVLDAIFDFAKSGAITPCGTTSVTITGDFDVEGGFARFSGADNRVKVTGCPRTK